MNHQATLLIDCSSRRRTRGWFGTLSVGISLLITGVPAQAQSDAARLKEKDAQISNLTAEIERLKAALGQTKPASAPATATTPVAEPAATAAATASIGLCQSGSREPWANSTRPGCAVRAAGVIVAVPAKKKR
jgi:hypothetical protein